MSNETLVSIIIPVYNRLNYLHDAIESVLNQSYPCIEIIIVDDGSSVNIQEFINKEFSSPKIKFFKKEHSGLSQSLNFGIKQAQGFYLAFLDDDDLWHPDMIQTCIFQLSSQKGDMAAVGYSYFKGRHDPEESPEQQIKSTQDILKILTCKNIFPVNTVVVKKNLVERVGCFNVAMSACMDWDLWLRLLTQGVKFTIIDKNLSFIRVHQNNLSRNEVLMKKGWLQVLENAQTYMPPNMQKILKLNQMIAFRRIVTKLYVASDNNKVLKKVLNLAKFIFRLRNIYN